MILIGNDIVVFVEMANRITPQVIYSQRPVDLHKPLDLKPKAINRRNEVVDVSPTHESFTSVASLAHRWQR
jgi:hypothetical protein